MTPKELMISRYEAFVKKDWEYLVKTSTHQTLAELQIPTSTEWLKLEIVDAYENIVEFKAYYKEYGKVGLLHEKSHFIKKDDHFLYDYGELYNSIIQRNESCPCGSGKKFKKCCRI